MLFVLMALKLLPEILDKLDVFILEIEELLIPKVISTNNYGLSLTIAKMGVNSVVNVKTLKIFLLFSLNCGNGFGLLASFQLQLHGWHAKNPKLST